MGSLECISLLAVLEHVPKPSSLAPSSAPGGRIVLTVPYLPMDVILNFLIRFHLADGTAEEEHHGFDVGETVGIFEASGLSLRAHRRFQLGLNQLFVFEKP